MCRVDSMNSMFISKKWEVREMSEAMMTLIIGGIALSAIFGVVYEVFYADRE